MAFFRSPPESPCWGGWRQSLRRETLARADASDGVSTASDSLAMVESVTIPYQECDAELTCDDEPIVYCAECWEREFGDEPA